MPTLLIDKISKGKDKTIYALKGTKVTVISDNGTALIVENDKTKVRFSAKECEVKN